MILRPFQTECLEAIRTAKQAGILRQLVSLPTGGGKTVIFSALPRFLGSEKRTLVLAHREELLDQAADKFNASNPGAFVEIEQADRFASPFASIVIASVPSIGKAGSARIQKFWPEQFDLIITDEAHHCHVSGTPILTRAGYKPIEGIRVGDSVYGFSGSRFKTYFVVDTFSYSYHGPTLEISTEHGHVVCVTPNHKLFSNGRMVYARDLRPGDAVSVPSVRFGSPKSAGDLSAPSMETPWNETLPQVFRRHAAGGDGAPPDYASVGVGGLPPLWEEASKAIHRWPHYSSPHRHHFQQGGSASGHGKARAKYLLPGENFTANEREKPDGSTWFKGKNDRIHSQSYLDREDKALWWPSLWQWGQDDPSGAARPESLSGRLLSTLSFNWRWAASTSLQDRHRVARADDCARIGWLFAFTERSPIIGPKERFTPSVDRLDGPQGLERGGYLREDRVSFVRIRNYSGLVHDIEVGEAHNYIANGILSSNSTAPTYQNIYKHFGLGERKDILHVGFTATPKRGDKTGLDSTFEDIVYHKDIQWMIDNGYLARITGRRVSTGTNLSRVNIHLGDFKSKDLARAVNNADRNAAIVKSYVVYAFGKKCLVFAVDVAHAISLKDYFIGHGIRAEVVTGETPREERAKILAAYALGEIKVLVNCMVLTEGFDEPSIEVIIMARPTTSSLLHTQMVGRGTRLFPGKEECLIIDMVDNSSKHSIRTIPSLFGLPANLDLQGGDARSAEKKYKAFVADHPHSRLAVEPEQLTSLDLLDLKSEKIDFFKAPTFSPEVLANSQLTWIAHESGFVMNAGHKKEARIEKDILGQYEITLTANDQTVFQAKEKDTGSAFRAADGAVKDLWPDSIGLLNRASGWRRDKASKGQLDLLQRLKVPFPSDITKGDASVLISQALAKK